MRAYGATGGFQAVEQTLDVKEGELYDFTAAVRNYAQDTFSARDRTGAYGQLVIRWLDEGGKEVGRVWSETWDVHLSRIRWQDFSIEKTTVPVGAVRAFVGIHLYEGRQGALGTFLVDDAALTLHPPKARSD
jgi:hypothetical protein